MCACRRVSRSALSAGKVRMIWSIAPPRITRMRFMFFVATVLWAVFIDEIETACLDRPQAGGYRRVPLILRKRELENYTTVNQRDCMETAPAKNTASAPTNLIAKDVRDRDPEQAGDDKQVGKDRHK